MNENVTATTAARAAVAPAQFRVESAGDISGALWPQPGTRQVVVGNRELAILLAAKSTPATGLAIQVVHVPSGEVIFSKG